MFAILASNLIFLTILMRGAIVSLSCFQILSVGKFWKIHSLCIDILMDTTVPLVEYFQFYLRFAIFIFYLKLEKDMLGDTVSMLLLSVSFRIVSKSSNRLVGRKVNLLLLRSRLSRLLSKPLKAELFMGFPGMKRLTKNTQFASTLF